MSYQYLAIPRVRVQSANAQPAWWIIGPPGVTAYAGFAHALALAIESGPHRGIGIVHHDLQLLGEDGRRWHPHQFRAAGFIDKDDYSSKNAHVLSSQPTARCHLTVSLIIRFDEEASIDMEGKVPRFLRRARIAGGSIVEYAKPKITETLQDAVKAVGNGFGLHERQDLMVREVGDEDMLDVLLRLTRRKEDGPSWLCPTTLGFVTITPQRPRRNVRGGFPHAFAEPLVGMTQFLPLRKGELPFWQYRNPQPNVFVVTTA